MNQKDKYSNSEFSKKMKNQTASMLVIGDEILSGRTRESNIHFLAIELSKVGIDLKEVRIVGD